MTTDQTTFEGWIVQLKVILDELNTLSHEDKSKGEHERPILSATHALGYVIKELSGVAEKQRAAIKQRSDFRVVE